MSMVKGACNNDTLSHWTYMGPQKLHAAFDTAVIGQVKLVQEL